MRISLKYSVTIIAGISVLATIVGNGCRVDPQVVPEVSKEDVKFYIPQGFPQPVYSFQNNTVTPEGFQLGRKLFYDTRLSMNNAISCGNCHQQFVAFANSGHQFSHGFDGSYGTRNAPPLFNLAWNQLFMWDGGINHIESQPLGPIQNPVEMNESIANVIIKLNAVPSYHTEFEKAFGTDSITTQRICRALAQFMGVMISANSKYDQYIRGEVSLSVAEESGLALYRTKCSSCHTEPLFTDEGFHNNGLTVDNTLNDFGRMRITLNPADSLKFKTPSLRNVAVTGPYMHDGRFLTLQDCVDHYSTGVVQSSTLDPMLSTGIPLTIAEKADLIAFLSTLTDFSFMSDSKFSEIH